MTEPFKKESSGLYTIEKWQKAMPGLAAGFTSKQPGSGIYSRLNMAFHVHDHITDVQQNRREAGVMIGLEPDQWVSCEQTHGANIVHVTEKEKGRGAWNYETALPDTDAIYTKEKNLLLTLCFADCVPLYFLDRKTRKIGAAHAGWRGSVAGIGPKLIQQWLQEGSQASQIEAVIGPSICGSCYKVSAEVIEAVNAWYKPANQKPYTPAKEPDTFFLSLQQFNRDLLVQAGLLPNQIFTTQFCSSCSPDFFSHRRDNGATGRMMSYIGWKE